MELNGPWFVDKNTKKTILFKGINLGGGSKTPNGIPSHKREGYWVDYDRTVDFVGRPFPLNEADEHLSRMVNYGFNLIRFVVTWEAIEHEGPGIYDEAYVNYVIQLLKKCENYKLRVYLDPHQDCWSRHCGGSGSPGWTHVLAGLNPLNFPDTEAAIVHNLYPNPEEFPKMVWNTNYQKLAAATLFTLFFGGNTFAPKCRVNGKNVQDYLQEHYFNAICHVAKRVHENGLENTVVIGYDTMNEPGQGYLSVQDITKLSQVDTDFKNGFMPTAFQSMLLGSGVPTKVEHWEFTWSGPKKSGEVLLDPKGKHAWLSEKEQSEADSSFGWKRDPDWIPGCIWANHGVWDKESQQVLVPDFFSKHDGKKVAYIDHWLEYFKKYVGSIRRVHKDAFIFVQTPVLEVPPKLDFVTERLVYAPHWYDGLTLVKKKWCNYNIDFINLSRGKYGTGPLRFIRALRIGEKAIRQCFVDQLKTIKEEGLENIGEYPCILGEIGIPYDMEVEPRKSIFKSVLLYFLCLFSKQKEGYIMDPNSNQNKAMDANLNALEENLLNYTLWNYVPENDAVWGDQWNGEDLSIFRVNKEFKPTLSSVTTSSTLIGESSDEKIRKNIRDIVSLHRPHPRETAGIPAGIKFVSPTEKTPAFFEYEMKPAFDNDCYSEIHVPIRYFPIPPISTVEVTAGKWELSKKTDEYWVLSWCIDREHTAGIQPRLRLQGIYTV